MSSGRMYGIPDGVDASSVHVYGSLGNTGNVECYANVLTNIGKDIIYIPDTANFGDSFKILTTGIYYINTAMYFTQGAGAPTELAITVNSTALSSPPDSVPPVNILSYDIADNSVTANYTLKCSYCGILYSGDIIRVQNFGTPVNDNSVRFLITKLSA